MEYLIDNKKYTLSYEELKIDYQKFVSMTNKEFFSNIPSILHFICIVSYLKELPTSILLNDEGLIHQLVHMLDESTSKDPIIDNPSVRRKIRQNFKIICALA